jgi:hypothetical protein
MNATKNEFLCFFRACGFEEAIAKELQSEPMKHLKAYLKGTGTTCADIKDKVPICDAIAADAVDKLSAVSHRICENIKRLQTFDNARLPKHERDIIHAIMRMFGLQEQGLSDKQKCQRVEEHFASLLSQLKTVIKVETTSKRRYPSLRKVLMMVLFGVVSAIQPVCTAATQPQTADSCALTIANGNSLFESSVATVNLSKEITSVSKELEFYHDVRARVRGSTFAGTPTNKVATFVIGNPGIGKDACFQKVIQESPGFAEGVRGAVRLNAETIREAIPGYNASVQLGQIGSDSTVDQAVNTVTSQLVNELIGEDRSVVIDRTGDDLEVLQKEMNEIRGQGYRIHAIVVSGAGSDKPWHQFLEHSNVDLSTIVRDKTTQIQDEKAFQSIQNEETIKMWDDISNHIPRPTEPLPIDPDLILSRDANSELFGERGPHSHDIDQGAVGTCYLMATLSSVAYENPALFRENIRATHDPEVYQIRFYYADEKGQTRDQWVAVTDSLYRKQNKKGILRVAYAHTLDNDGDGRPELWVALYEKAFAHFAVEHNLFPGNLRQGYGYIGLGGQPGVAYFAITGHQTDIHIINFLNTSGHISGPGITRDHRLWNILTECKTRGFSPMVSVVIAPPGEDEPAPGIIGNHAYSVVGAEEVDGRRMVILRNPWGNGNPQSTYRGHTSHGVFTIELGEFQRIVDMLTVRRL